MADQISSKEGMPFASLAGSKDAKGFVSVLEDCLTSQSLGPDFKRVSTIISSDIKSALDGIDGVIFILDCLVELEHQLESQWHDNQTEYQEQEQGAQQHGRGDVPEQEPLATGATEQQPSNAISVPSRMRAASAITHMLLDIMQSLTHGGAPATSALAQVASPGGQPAPERALQLPDSKMVEAGDLLLSYATSREGAKLAAKLASALRLKMAHIRNWELLVVRLQDMLDDRNTCGPAVRLMMQIEGLDEAVDKVQVLGMLVADGQEPLAEKWASSLGRDYQVLFVDACVALDRLKPAAKAVRTLGLQEEFPDIESMYRLHSLRRLMDRRLWSVALSFVGQDQQLQVLLLQEMLSVGEAALAADYRQQLSIPDGLLSIDPGQVAAAEAKRREQYLQLSLPPEAVMVVDSPEKLPAAAAALAAAEAVGIDVEWQPSHRAGAQTPAALLQVATRDAAYLFDLMALAGQHPEEISACLGPVFESQAITKLGFELSGDLSKLAGTWPGVDAFGSANAVLDLRPLWVAYGLKQRALGAFPTATARGLSQVGLSSLCKSLLGKPLDKSMQLSDWEARPLTSRQVSYAALDAHSLVLLHEKLVEGLGAAAAELVAQHTTTFRGARRRARGLALLDDGGGGGGAGAGGRAVAAFSVELEDGKEGGAEGGAAAGDPPVLAFLRRHGLREAFVRIDQGDAKAEAILAMPLSRVAKSMGIMADHQPWIVVTRGDHKIDMHKLATCVNAARKLTRFATEEELVAVFGFVPGTVPPVSHSHQRIRVLIDKRLGDAAADNHGSGRASGSACRAGEQAGRRHGEEQDGGEEEGGEEEGSEEEEPLLRCGAGVPWAAVLLRYSQIMRLSGGREADVAAGAAGEEGALPAGGGGGGAALCAAAGPGGRGEPGAPAGWQGPPSFLCDGMLGRLCRWLRCLGVDAELVERSAGRFAGSSCGGPGGGGPGPGAGAGAEPEAGEGGHSGRGGSSRAAEELKTILARIAESCTQQGRVFLTRDAKLTSRRDVEAAVYLLSSNDPAEQLREVSRHFGISWDPDSVMTRCSSCNTAALRLVAPKEAARGRVPERIFDLVEDFYDCAGCGKVYWVGPKSESAMQLMEALFTGAGRVPTPLRSTLPPRLDPLKQGAADGDMDMEAGS